MKRQYWQLSFFIATITIGSSSAYAELTILPGEAFINDSTDTPYLEVLDLLDNQGVFDN